MLRAGITALGNVNPPQPKCAGRTVKFQSDRAGIYKVQAVNFADLYPQIGFVTGTIRLDATPAGRAVYEKWGFIPEYNVARYEGIAPRGCDGTSVKEVRSDEFDSIDATAKSPKNVAKTAPTLQNRGVNELLTLASIVAFDKRLTGTDRGKMLNRLFQEHPNSFRLISNNGEPEGYITFRPGSNAFQIGPCVAVPAAGPALFSYAWSRCAGEPIFIDIPVDNIDAVKLAESGGLKVQRLFTRMYRGEKPSDSVQAIWASSGPEKG